MLLILILGSCCFSMMVRSVPQGRNFPHFMDVPRCMFSLCPDTRHGWRELSSRAGCGHSATPRPAARCAGPGGRSGPGTGCREYISQPWPCTPTAAPEHVAVLLPDSDDGGLGIIEHEEQHDQHEDDLQYSTVQYSTARPAWRWPTVQYSKVKFQIKRESERMVQKFDTFLISFHVFILEKHYMLHYNRVHNMEVCLFQPPTPILTLASLRDFS